jgi:hypothetical protein
MWGSNVVHVRQPHTGGSDKGARIPRCGAVSLLGHHCWPEMRATWGPGTLVIRCCVAVGKCRQGGWKGIGGGARFGYDSRHSLLLRAVVS